MCEKTVESYNRQGFTMIEIICTLMILGILSAIAMPIFFDFTQGAKQKTALSVEESLISAMRIAFGRHRIYNATSSGSVPGVDQWIVDCNSLKAYMVSNSWPYDTTCSGNILTLTDGTTFTIAAETKTLPAGLL